MTTKIEHYNMTRSGVCYPNPRGVLKKVSTPSGDVWYQYGDPIALCIVTGDENPNIKLGYSYTVFINAERLDYSTTTTKHIKSILNLYGVYDKTVPTYIDYLHEEWVVWAAEKIEGGDDIRTYHLSYHTAQIDVINAAIDKAEAKRARRAQLQKARRHNNENV